MSAPYSTKDLSVKFEIKEDHGDLDFVFIKGIASTFGNTDRTGDIIEPGAFKKTIKLMKAGERQIVFLNQHRMDQPIGVVDSLKEVGNDVMFEGRLAREHSIVKDMLALLKMKALHSVSIGFNIIDSEMDNDGLRTIKEVDLWELSIVTIPANEKAKITSVKKDENSIMEKDEKIVDAIKAESISTKKEYEQMLKDTGMFTKKAYITLASKFKEDSNQSDSGSEKKGRSDSVSEEEVIKSMQDFIDSLKK
jgi:hypothetical protein